MPRLRSSRTISELPPTPEAAGQKARHRHRLGTGTHSSTPSSVCSPSCRAAPTFSGPRIQYLRTLRGSTQPDFEQAADRCAVVKRQHGRAWFTVDAGREGDGDRSRPAAGPEGRRPLLDHRLMGDELWRLSRPKQAAPVPWRQVILTAAALPTPLSTSTSLYHVVRANNRSRSGR